MTNEPRTLASAWELEKAWRIETAWREWQSEESRDRGYDFELCQRLRKQYLKLKEELQCRQ